MVHPEDKAEQARLNAEAEDNFDQLMDDMQVLYTLRAGQTVSQEDVDALNRLDEHWREDGERVLDAYHRGWKDGMSRAGGTNLLELQERLDHLRNERAADRGVHRMQMADLRRLLGEARDLLMERTHGNPARSAAYNARLSIESAIAYADSDLAHAAKGVDNIDTPSAV